MESLELGVAGSQLVRERVHLVAYVWILGPRNQYRYLTLDPLAIALQPLQ